jgi:predicted ArsR family transcriptional regulator
MNKEIKDLKSLLGEKPMSLHQLSKETNLHINTVLKYLRFLIKEEIVQEQVINQDVYYICVNK